jgi:DNA gyrase/topoisomerase IV subunit B
MLSRKKPRKRQENRDQNTQSSGLQIPSSRRRQRRGIDNILTEGQSAGGSLISARDVMTQAIFTLKGKPQNVFGRNKSAIYQMKNYTI